MVHNENCMCDGCIQGRVRQKVIDRAEIERQRVFEEKSQEYIHRRGGIDPRRS